MFKNTTHKVQRMTDTSRLHERQHIHEEDDTSKGIISSFLLPVFKESGKTSDLLVLLPEPLAVHLLQLLLFLFIQILPCWLFVDASYSL